MSSKNFKYLDDLIHSGTKEIVLDSDIVLDDGEESEDLFFNGIKLDVDGLIIDGNGHIIDGKEKARIFSCTGKNITIKNITLKNGTHLSAILNRGILTVINSLFTNNRGYGGAIWNFEDAFLTIIDSTFANNITVRRGGGVYNCEGTLTIINSVFTGNYANHVGGAVCNFDGMVDITKSTFTDNSAGRHGEAIFCTKDGEVNLKDCTFEDNGFGDDCYGVK